MAYNLLKGKKGIIFGALNEMSIAWQVAEKCIEEGAEIVLTNTPLSIRMGDIQDFAAKHQIPLIPADATSVEDLTHLFQESMTHFGGKVDFILHSIGMSLNVRKKRPYDDLDYDFLQKTLDISAISFHKVLQTAKKLDAINEWGSVVALSYVAAQRTMFEYNDMADAKAMLESIARSFGYIYGREKQLCSSGFLFECFLHPAGQGQGNTVPVRPLPPIKANSKGSGERARLYPKRQLHGRRRFFYP